MSTERVPHTPVQAHHAPSSYAPSAARSLPITTVVAVKNEASNLERCLGSLRSVERVLVVDSGSTDRTCDIARENGAELLQFRYMGAYPKKREWTILHAGITSEWILLVDADEVVPGALINEIRHRVTAPCPFSAFLARKQFHFLGRRFRFGGFGHDAVVLFRNGKAHFERLEVDYPELDMEVHERLIVDGRLGRLRHPLIHQDFKGLEKYIERHNAYSTWESQLRRRFLATGVYGTDTVRARIFGNTQERRRFLKRLALAVPFEAQLWFVYHYILRLGVLEGRRGLIASQLRASYIRQVRAKMFEARANAAGRTV